MLITGLLLSASSVVTNNLPNLFLWHFLLVVDLMCKGQRRDRSERVTDDEKVSMQFVLISVGVLVFSV